VLTFWLHAVLSAFAVLNPIGNVPIFLALVGGEPPAVRERVSRRALGVAGGIVAVFALAGTAILRAFGVTLDDFRVAGGILLFVIAFGLIQGRMSAAHHPSPDEVRRSDEDVAVTPLGTPMLAGPGTIATVMALSAEPPLIAHSLLVLLAFGLVLAFTWGLFHYAVEVEAHLGHTLISVITRMMGLLLTMVAVQMVSDGIHGLFPHGGA
jgi:multiple antibiotic resistance protein